MIPPVLRRPICHALTLSVLLGSLGTSPQAQSVQGTPPKSASATPPAAITAPERRTLQNLFAKVRPATLRIEDCPPNNCADPDGVGTAFLISADGLALTAYHVVFGSKNLSAVTLNKARYAVEVVGFDDQHDLALLRVKVPQGTPFLPLAASLPKIGDAALAVGNGNGAFLQPKTGRLTALDADAGRADFPPGTLELTAPLVPGDSGGPIINAQGQVTGVVSYITVTGKDEHITSYAVPVTTTAPLLAELRSGVKREAPVIGISLVGDYSLLSELPAEDFKEANEVLELDLGDTPGAFFNAVSPNSPAARAGLQALRYDQQGRKVAGDIVTAVNGKRIFNFNQFQYAVRAFRPGDTITLTVLRGTQTLSVKLTLTGRSQVRN
ncbi:S1C family serine protease [Deinococcus hohokamensis]|uniref:S1C family serine protease n=1 Tax=Deinococcus hohokamensis TaxID=309883 RepID=A0ABV9IF41_9DEIO